MNDSPYSLHNKTNANTKRAIYKSASDFAGLKFEDKSKTFFIELNEDGGVLDSVFLHIPFTSIGKTVSVTINHKFITITSQKFSMTMDVFEQNADELIKAQNTWAWARLIMDRDEIPTKVGQTGIVFSHIFYTNKKEAFLGRLLIGIMVRPLFIKRIGSTISLAYRIQVTHPPNKELHE